jgi:Secretion system C-terminal sorting domain
VPATAINNNSSDNCTSTSALSYAICRGVGCTNFAANLSLPISLVPTGQTFVILPVTLRVTDACGNVSMCNSNIRFKKLGTLANNNSTNTLVETADSAIETPPTPTVPSNIDATHGSMKCFPNPFADDLNINYNLTSDVENLVIKVYDNQGRVVRVNAQGESLAGYYQMRWNLADLPSGMYHVCLEADAKCLKVERVILTK